MKTVRKKPFGEWNVVYFDDTKTTPDEILKRLRAKGCPRAKRVPDRKLTANRATLTVKNPYVAPGDCILLELGGKPAGKPHIALPEGWTLFPGPSDPKSGVTWLYAQTPKKAKPGEYDITMEAPGEGKKPSAKASVSVDVVSYIK